MQSASNFCSAHFFVSTAPAPTAANEMPPVSSYLSSSFGQFSNDGLPATLKNAW